LAGMPEKNIKHVQMVADKYGVEVQVRPTNPDARALLESGEGYPKPEMIKMKTINNLDIQLGAPTDGAGKVGYFEPQLPSGVKSVGELPEDLASRYRQRMDEYVDQRGKVAHLSDPDQIKPGERLIEVRDGVVHDRATNKPFTGDHDLFDIRGMNGEELPKAVRDRVVRDLRDVPAQAQHGDHMSWDYSKLSRERPPAAIDPVTGAESQAKSPWEIAKGVDDKILAGHGPGKEPLITFRSNAETGIPVERKLEFSAYTGAERPERLSDFQKTLQRWGVSEEQFERMSTADIERLIGGRSAKGR